MTPSNPAILLSLLIGSCAACGGSDPPVTEGSGQPQNAVMDKNERKACVELCWHQVMCATEICEADYPDVHPTSFQTSVLGDNCVSAMCDSGRYSDLKRDRPDVLSCMQGECRAIVTGACGVVARCKAADPDSTPKGVDGKPVPASVPFAWSPPAR